MTEYQESKIYELRFKGTGYKAIGNLLGLTRDAVRGFCKKHGLDGDGIVTKLNYQIKKENGVLCVCCGIDFESYGNKNRKYCCHECYIKTDLERMKTKTPEANIRSFARTILPQIQFCRVFLRTSLSSF